MSKMVSEAVDTADLSKSDDTKPVIPSQLHSEVWSSQIIWLLNSGKGKARFFITIFLFKKIIKIIHYCEQEVEGSFLKSIIVPYVWPHIEYSSFTHVPRFQEICGVRLMPKVSELNG